MTWRVTAVRCANLNRGYYIEEGEVADVSIWHRVSRVLKVLLLLTIVGTIIGAFLPVARDQRNERLKEAQLQEQINAQRRLLARNERQVNFLTNSPEYVEAVARDKFGLMKPGETVFQFDDSKSKAALAPVLPLAPKRMN